MARVSCLAIAMVFMAFIANAAPILITDEDYDSGAFGYTGDYELRYANGSPYLSIVGNYLLCPLLCTPEESTPVEKDFPLPFGLKQIEVDYDQFSEGNADQGIMSVEFVGETPKYLFSGFTSSVPRHVEFITSADSLLLRMTSTECFGSCFDGFFGIDNLKITATVLSSVPEPSTLFLFGTGLFGLLGYSRRRR